MVDIYISGSVSSEAATQEHEFRIVRGERHIGLPQRHIDELDLKRSKSDFIKVVPGVAGLTNKTAYAARVIFSGSSMDLDVLPSGEPTVSVAILRSLGFQIDLEHGSVKGPETPLAIHTGLLPIAQPVGYDRTYATSDDGWVYALDADSLEPEWRNSRFAGQRITHLAVGNGKVYLALADGWVYALDAGNLEFEWRNNLLKGRTITHLALGNGKVYLALADGWVYALDAVNLEFEWRNSELAGQTIAHFTVANAGVFAALDDGEIYVLDAGNPELRRRVKLPEGKKVSQLVTAQR